MATPGGSGITSPAAHTALKWPWRLRVTTFWSHAQFSLAAFSSTMCTILHLKPGFFLLFYFILFFQKHILKNYKAELQSGWLLQYIWKYFQTASHIKLATCMRANKPSTHTLQGLLKQRESGSWHGWDGNLTSLTVHPRLCLKLFQTTD